MYYLDSSAIVKRYVRETGTEWVNQLYAKDARLYTVRISSVEVVSAFFMRKRNKTLSQISTRNAMSQFLRDWETRFQVLEVAEPIVQSAIELIEKYPLRGYDAVQLAAAIELNLLRSQLNLTLPIFVSADKKLVEVAAELDLIVENPNDHPATDDGDTPPAR